MKTILNACGGTWGGLNKYDPLLNQFVTFHHKSDDINSISNNVIWSVNTDSQGNVWIGTQKGVNCWKLKENKFYHYTTESKGKFKIPYDNIGEAYVDTKGVLWIGTWGGGLIRMDTTTGKWMHLKNDNKSRLSSPIASDNLHNIFEDSKGRIWIGTFGAGMYRYEKENDTFIQYNHNINDSKTIADVNIRVIAEDKQGRIWVGTNQGLSMFDARENIFRNYKNQSNDTNSLSHNTINAIHAHSDEKTLWIGTMTSFDCYDLFKNTWKRYLFDPSVGTMSVNGILEDRHGNLWLSSSKGILSFHPDKQIFKAYASEEILKGNEFHLKASDKTKEGCMIFGGTNGFLYFHPDSLKNNTIPVKTVLTNFKINNEIVPIGENSLLKKHISFTPEINLNYDQSSFTIEFAGIHHTLPQKDRFQYLLEGLDADWQNIGSQQFLSFHHLPYGKYTLKIKGANSDGIWEEKGVELIIIMNPPWWQTWWARFSLIFFVVSVLFVIYKNRINQIKRQRQKLEQIVLLRTQELLNQKEEIKVIAENLQAANEQISRKNHAIQQAYNLIEVQNREITDSMHYASKIQKAMLPFPERMTEVLGENHHFILYKPRDIVSGDFYWIEENSDKIVMVVSDCTGHGIPGAFMSFIGIAYLEYIVISRKIFEPELILKELHIGIRHALKQSSGDNRDGMDASVVVLNKKDNVFSVLEYSGAMNPLYFIKQQEDGSRILEEIKANKLPIGGESEKERNYSKHTFSIQHEKITHIYLFSDGYQDQFGGKQNKKFKVKPFRDLISTICQESMITQKNILEQTLHNWMEEGKEPQTDDITVLGVKIL